MIQSQTARRILVIDDHPDSAESFCALLQVFGHQVETAETGEEGLRKIRAFRPEIVFCDWRLPGMGGADVAIAVKSDPETAHTFMVSLTAFADGHTRQTALASGFDVHLVKPPEIPVLQRLLDHAGDSGTSGLS